jgi:hypothetical protein
MRGRDLALFTVLASLIALPALVFAQQPPPWPAPSGAQPPPAAWPDPPGTDQPPAPPPKTKGKKAKNKKTPPPQEPPDPRFEEEPAADGSQPPGPGPTPAPAPAPRKQAAAFNIQCDGPFAKDASHAKLAKTFGARNVVAAPGAATTVVFPNDPKRRIEVTWRDGAGRSRPSMILVEAQSTWRVRGFRLGDLMSQVEKANGKPLRFAGFGATPGGNARDWQGGKLDQLSGGCVLGMRFAPNSKTPQDALTKVTVGSDLTSDSADVRAVKPVIVEMIVGYPE